jgi:hypothetical protein
MSSGTSDSREQEALVSAKLFDNCEDEVTWLPEQAVRAVT